MTPVSRQPLPQSPGAVSKKLESKSASFPGSRRAGVHKGGGRWAAVLGPGQPPEAQNFPFPSGQWLACPLSRLSRKMEWPASGNGACCQVLATPRGSHTCCASRTSKLIKMKEELLDEPGETASTSVSALQSFRLPLVTDSLTS